MTRIIDLSNKKLNDLSSEELIYLHISGRNHERTLDFHLSSSLQQIQASMRSASITTNSKFYGPAMCAFAILDQLGTCYDIQSANPPTKNTSIKRALHNFCGIPSNSAEAQHLYAFRNGQMHDASYANEDRDGNWYMFRNNESINSVIKLPKTAWDGSANSIGPDTTTLISGDKLIELASGAVTAVENIFWTQRANLILKVPKSTLIHKYLLWYN